MDIGAYIDSGILQEYALGILTDEQRAEVERICAAHAEIKMALRNIELGLQKFAEANAVWPGDELQNRIWATLENVNKEAQMNAENLPLINEFTDYKSWLRFVQDKLPTEHAEEQFVQMLQHNDQVTQILLSSKTDIPKETHEDVLESFVILEGRCECYVGDHTFQLGPGGFTEIPLHVPHSVKMLTPRVVAIVQHIAV